MESPDSLKILKVATRMLMDFIVILEKKETVYEVGCKCKDDVISKALKKTLEMTLQDFPVSVIIKDETIVVILPEEISTQPPLPPSPPSLS